jgi:hypothetical protein
MVVAKSLAGMVGQPGATATPPGAGDATPLGEAAVDGDGAVGEAEVVPDPVEEPQPMIPAAAAATTAAGTSP